MIVQLGIKTQYSGLLDCQTGVNQFHEVTRIFVSEIMPILGPCCPFLDRILKRKFLNRLITPAQMYIAPPKLIATILCLPFRMRLLQCSIPVT